MSEATSADSCLFGCEMIFKINEKHIKTKYDVMICFAHWVLTRHGFLCGGVGDDITLPKRDELSELMPEGWNTDPPFKLRYVYKNQLYILSGLADESELIINLSRPVDGKVYAITINDNEVTETHGTIEKMMPNYSNIRKHITNELVNPMLQNEVTKEATTQTVTSNQFESRPGMYKPMRSIQDVPSQPMAPLIPRGTNIGESDLFPPMLPGPLGVGGGFGRGGSGGGGMLFEPPGLGPRAPFADPGLPRGFLPPGARYDPIRPPNPFQPPPGAGPSRHNHPDHDHLPPPGYDDMFM